MSINAIEQARLSRKLANLKELIKKLERFFSGEPLGTVRFSDLAVTDAKIDGMSADKIETGTLQVSVDVGESMSGSVQFIGEDVQMLMYDDDELRVFMGILDGAFTVRISLDGIGALDSDDPRDFSLFADEDNVLIKEFVRGNVEIDSSGTPTQITHSLGYPPHVYAYGEMPSGRYRLINGWNLFGDWRMQVDTTKLYLVNVSGTNDLDCRYFIFYDDVPE